MSATTERTWSAQQRAIFDWFRDGAGHLVVTARAGTGKTTTIIEALNYAPEKRILLAAFNKKIATELQERIANQNAEAKTLHALGYGLIRRYWERVGVDSRGERAASLAARGWKDSGWDLRQVPDDVLRLTAKLVTKAREIEPHAAEPGDLRALMAEHDLEPDHEWEVEGFDADALERAALAALVAATERCGSIDFSDMIFLPVRNGWLRPRYDLVVVDEAQDMTAAQLEIARGVCGGRVAVVGDDRQAIYGFRGADSDSLDRLKRELGATELSLTTTYRCGRSIVELAARLVPDYAAAPTSPEGLVVNGQFGKAMEAVEPDDFVLSRKNAPLVSVALAFIRQGRRAKIEGRDIGAGLKALIRKLATGKARNSLPQLRERIDSWCAREVERAEKRELWAKADRARDQAETLLALMDGVGSVREIEARIEDLFANDPQRGTITCSSVHRAKGLEAERVFVLADTLYPMLPCECGHRHFDDARCACGCANYRPRESAQREEENIHYVAVTRAKRELWMVSGLPGQNGSGA